MNSEKRVYTHEEVEQSFHNEIRHHIQDGQRIPSRNDTKESILEFAREVYNARYSKALHPSVLETYE